MKLEDFRMMTLPESEAKTDYNVREIIRYCREKNISAEELKKFERPKAKEVEELIYKTFLQVLSEELGAFLFK